jgi:hypothetical protein
MNAAIEPVPGTRVELKLCETCGRTFCRDAQSGGRDCPQCVGLRPAPLDLPVAPFMGKGILRRVKTKILRELFWAIRRYGITSQRAIDLVDAAELVDQVLKK